MWYLTEMCSIKHTVILTLSDWEVKGTHGPHATHIRHHNNLMTLDGSYLKQNSIPLLDLLQEISKHAMEGVKKELPQCTTPLTSTEDWRCGRWLGGSRLRHVGSFGFSWLWADLSFKSSWILMKGNRSQVWPFPKAVLAGLGKWMFEVRWRAQGTAPSHGINSILVLLATMGNITVGKNG